MKSDGTKAYSNSLILNGKAFVPISSADDDLDKAALQVYNRCIYMRIQEIPGPAYACGVDYRIIVAAVIITINPRVHLGRFIKMPCQDTILSE